jgi:hypothetical protein
LNCAADWPRDDRNPFRLWLRPFSSGNANREKRFAGHDFIVCPQGFGEQVNFFAQSP